MGGKAKAIGALLLLVAVASFLVNFKIWHPWLIGNIQLLWNPVGYELTPRLLGWVGSIPLLGGALKTLLNGIFALIYSAVLFVIGIVALSH
jgi:nitrate/nitrite transporter NarK